VSITKDGYKRIKKFKTDPEFGCMIFSLFPPNVIREKKRNPEIKRQI
jgi:hypothetical protein